MHSHSRIAAMPSARNGEKYSKSQNRITSLTAQHQNIHVIQIHGMCIPTRGAGVLIIVKICILLLQLLPGLCICIKTITERTKMQ